MSLSPEERCERTRMALAEVGWVEPMAVVFWDDDHDAVGVDHDDDLPPETIWRAWAVGDPANLACWPCYEAALSGAGWDTAAACTHDPLASPWPEVVR